MGLKAFCAFFIYGLAAGSDQDGMALLQIHANHIPSSSEHSQNLISKHSQSNNSSGITVEPGEVAEAMKDSSEQYNDSIVSLEHEADLADAASEGAEAHAQEMEELATEMEEEAVSARAKAEKQREVANKSAAEAKIAWSVANATKVAADAVEDVSDDVEAADQAGKDLAKAAAATAAAEANVGAADDDTSDDTQLTRKSKSGRRVEHSVEAETEMMRQGHGDKAEKLPFRTVARSLKASTSSKRSTTGRHHHGNGTDGDSDTSAVANLTSAVSASHTLSKEDAEAAMDAAEDAAADAEERAENAVTLAKEMEATADRKEAMAVAQADVANQSTAHVAAAKLAAEAVHTGLEASEAAEGDINAAVEAAGKLTVAEEALAEAEQKLEQVSSGASNATDDSDSTAGTDGDAGEE